MRLTCLKPRLQVLDTTRGKMLDHKAGTTPRVRGRAGQAMRRQALAAGEYQCVDCGRVSLSNEVDHEVPLEQGGSNDQSNLRVRCKVCHVAKTSREASARAGG